VLNCFLIAGMQALTPTHSAAQAQDSHVSSTDSGSVPAKPVPASVDSDESTSKDSSALGVRQDNSLGKEFIQHLVSDQKAIVTSPAHLRWADGSWLFPLAAISGGLFATDRAVPPALSRRPEWAGVERPVCLLPSQQARHHAELGT